MDNLKIGGLITTDDELPARHRHQPTTIAAHLQARRELPRRNVPRFPYIHDHIYGLSPTPRPKETQEYQAAKGLPGRAESGKPSERIRRSPRLCRALTTPWTIHR